MPAAGRSKRRSAQIIAPNITPDPETGIGAWTDQEFIDALTKGTGRNGMHLYPAMPYNYYTKVTRDDALAIRAYLKTVPAVQNVVHADQLPFPFSIRQSMIGWNLLFFIGIAVPAGRRQKRGMESRRLSDRGTGALRRLPHAEEFLGRRQEQRTSCKAIRCRAGSPPTSPTISVSGLGGWSVDEVASLS